MALHAAHFGDGSVSFERGPYQVERVLGRGRTAVVHLARRGTGRDTGERFAVKRLLPELRRSPDFVQMLTHEAWLGHRTTHPNLVPVVDAGEDGGSPAIVMPHVDGTTLGRLLGAASRRALSFPIDVSLFIAREVLKGIGHLHDLRGPDERPLGVVHADVSPGNVLLGAMGEVMLTDLGSARSARSGPFRTGVDGKLGYMPPEQLTGLPLDRRSDLFSVGLLLYEMLTGVPFFHGVDDLDLTTQMRRASLAPLSNPIGRRLPLDVRLLLATALAREPEDRFMDAAEFSWALDLCALHSGIRLARPGLIQWLRDNDVWPLQSGFHAAVSPGSGTSRRTP
ncbi:MAG TPA: serine/threonine-protein kinase [Polyangiaceae bacterium]|nr:serine/threonine-protein kinase [Polyangiaceae bacterium]